MSKLTALLTTLAIGSSASIAAASPARLADHRAGTVAVRGEHPVVAMRGERPIERRPIERPIERPVVVRPVVERRDWRPAPALHVTRDRFAPAAFDAGWHRSTAVDDFGPRHYRPTWVALSSPQPFVRGQDCIGVGDSGTFTQLRLQSDSGFAFVDRVTVQFADGSDQVAELDRRLDQRGEFVELALDGNNRRIDRIVVTGTAGDLQVFAI
jgi:hypothetical protein